MGHSCFASILNQFPLMLKNPAPLTSSRKPPRVLPISYDLPLYGPSTCLVHVSPQALNYCAVPKGPPGWVMRPTLERCGRACSPLALCLL